MDRKVFLDQIDAVNARGPFRADWRSLEGYVVPAWYKDAKFGIFIHWGVYSVPGVGNEWYPRNMYRQGTWEFEHHAKTFGPQLRFGYKDFIPLLTAERFDPAHWADLFRRAGARYVVPVAEHHDGFAMYDCPFSRWNAAAMGPKRDVLRDLAAEVRRRDLVFGLSSHRAEHWFFMEGGRRFASDVNDPGLQDFYGPARPQDEPPDRAHLEDWLCRCCDLVDRFRPQVFWFDWWIEEPAWEPWLRRFAAYYYNRAAEWGEGVAINYKHRAFPEGTAVLDVERGQLADTWPVLWQTDTSVSRNSWGYIRHHDYKSAGEIVRDLADIVSKNGVLLLNVGPRPDGSIPEPEEAILLAIGDWLRVNGEAIYDTRTWKVFGEGPTRAAAGAFGDARQTPFTSSDVRFTAGPDALYAIVMGWPETGRWLLRSLAEGSKNAPREIRAVELLGSGPLRWSRSKDGLLVDAPAAKPCEHAFVLKIA
jgi:alpha-L-fucosidase